MPTFRLIDITNVPYKILNIYRNQVDEGKIMSSTIFIDGEHWRCLECVGVGFDALNFSFLISTFSSNVVWGVLVHFPTNDIPLG
jgi:hypothetical protein